jgi:predicted glycoside hydrolase/deacetylase ChbG (UPF0249 family)
MALPAIDSELALPAGANVILCADDFAMTDGVSRGIEELALARRLSATSALVTLPAWRRQAPRLREIRAYVAIGLHVNLTLGAPLGPMPGIARDGELPAHADLVRRALTRGLPRAEIAAEIERQFDRFVQGSGFAPDFVDGHQHVHTLPVVRTALLDVLGRRRAEPPPLVRDPGDALGAVLQRRAGAHKALAIALLARGFGARVRAAGFPTNHGFSGVSGFDLESPYGRELAAFFSARGRRHMVMCHPGYVDPELGELDEVVERRHQELDALFTAPGLEAAIWHVRRNADGPCVDWQEALPA